MNKLFVLGKSCSFKDSISTITGIIKQSMANRFHMGANLMGSASLQATFYQGDITQSFNYAVMCNGLFSRIGIGENRHLKTILGMPANVSLYGTLIFFYISPNQGNVFSGRSFSWNCWDKLAID